MENNIDLKAMVQPFIEDNASEWEVVAEGVTRKIMTYDDCIMLVKVAFEEGAIGTVHQHYHTQVSYVASGVFEVEIGGNKKILKKGDVFHATPNILHGVVCLEKGLLIDVFNPMREDFMK